MILVDTSAWVDFFRGSEPCASWVDQLLAENQVAICGPVVTELRRGLRSDRERRRVLPLLEGCSSLDQPSDLWNEAGELGFALARKGSLVKSLDLLIAVHALAHDVALLTRDKDFELIRRGGSPLRLA